MALRLKVSIQKAQLEQDIVQAELAERVYARMEAAGIWVDPDTKNRILSDIVSSVIDTTYVHMQKAFADTVPALNDSLDLMVEKHINEVIAFIETRTFDVTKTVSDAATVSELKQLTLTRPVQDSYAIGDASARTVDKGHSDAVTTADILTRTVTFNPTFSDVMTVDDAMNIDKAWDSTKGNVAFIGDLSEFLLTRPVADTLSTADMNQFTFSKLKAEALSAIDVASVAHYLGAAQIFNRPLFNQTTFG